ncbi:MAG TPA: VTT domain-containing protein [Microbacteriaceae bacterium]|nr:VTT domain-containing protein [Microbacteriaceae bacterium]
MDPVTDLVMHLMASPWVYPVLFALVVIDGFFPPVPSESVVVAAAAVGIASGAPAPWLIVLVAALGAALGDNIAYWIGRRAGVRFRWMRRRRVRRMLARSGRALRHRTAVVILTARYIPVGRLAVNMTAGATRLSWRRFWPLTVLGGVSWSIYSTMVGLVAGTWAHNQPLVAAAVGIVIAVALGLATDQVTTRVRQARRRHALRRRLSLRARRLPSLASAATPQGGAQ